MSWEIRKIEISIQRKSYRKCYGLQYCLWEWSDSSSSWRIIFNNFFLLCTLCRAFVIWFSSKTQKFWSRTFFILCFLICFFSWIKWWCTMKVVKASAALGNGPLHVFYFVRGFKIALWAILRGFKIALWAILRGFKIALWAICRAV